MESPGNLTITIRLLYKNVERSMVIDMSLAGKVLQARANDVVIILILY